MSVVAGEVQKLRSTPLPCAVNWAAWQSATGLDVSLLVTVIAEN